MDSLDSRRSDLTLAVAKVMCVVLVIPRAGGVHPVRAT